MDDGCDQYVTHVTANPPCPPLSKGGDLRDPLSPTDIRSLPFKGRAGMGMGFNCPGEGQGEGYAAEGAAFRIYPAPITPSPCATWIGSER